MRKTIIMLHGMGGDKNTMSTIGKHCGRLVSDADFVSLEAPFNLGTVEKPRRAWFEPPDDDKRELERPDPPQFKGIDESLELVHQTIERVLNDGVHSQSVYLLGHSQGGALSITAGLTFPEPLGGIFSIAGYLAWLPTLSLADVRNDFYLHHSLHDDVVGFRWAEYTKSFIQQAGHVCDVCGWDIANSPHLMHKRQLDAICNKIE